MGFEFVGWFLGLSLGNFLFTIPLYLLVSFTVYRFAKNKSGLKIFALTFGLLIFTMILLESFTIANTVSGFFEVLLLIWMGNAFYFGSRKEVDNGIAKGKQTQG